MFVNENVRSQLFTFSNESYHICLLPSGLSHIGEYQWVLIKKHLVRLRGVCGTVNG